MIRWMSRVKLNETKKRMRSPGINGEGELRGQLANPGSPGKWPLKVCVCLPVYLLPEFDCRDCVGELVDLVGKF